MDNKTVEIQHQVRQNAMKLQEEMNSMKKFEQDMKTKEQEMLKNAAMEVAASQDVSYLQLFIKIHRIKEPFLDPNTNSIKY